MCACALTAHLELIRAHFVLHIWPILTFMVTKCFELAELRKLSIVSCSPQEHVFYFLFRSKSLKEKERYLRQLAFEKKDNQMTHSHKLKRIELPPKMH